MWEHKQRHMQRIEELERFAAEVAVFISESPAVEAESIALADSYLNDLRAYQSTMNQYLGEAEIIYSEACIKSIIACKVENWTRIKGSATQQNAYCKAQNGREYLVYFTLKGHSKTLSEAASQFMTLISMQKEVVYQSRDGVSPYARKDKDPMSLG